MFLESRATSARMSTPSMTSPTWLYCGFPEQGKKKCLCCSNVGRLEAKSWAKPEKTWATLSDYGWISQRINSIDDGRKEHLRDSSFFRGKKIFTFQILARTFEGCTMCTKALIHSKWGWKFISDLLRFPLWNLSRPSCQLPIDGGFQNQTAAATNEKTRGMRARLCVIAHKLPGKTRGDQEGKAIAVGKLRLLLKRLAPTLPKWWIYRSDSHFLSRALSYLKDNMKTVVFSQETMLFCFN